MISFIAGIIIGIPLAFYLAPRLARWLHTRATPTPNAHGTLRSAPDRLEQLIVNVPTTQGNIDRGFELADQVECLSRNGLYAVPGKEQPTYTVDLVPDPPMCTCKAAFHRPDLACKHVVAAAVHSMVPH